MTTGMLQESVPSVTPGMGPKFRPYASPNHHVTKGRYITSNDPRGYIPVYEYPLNGQWIMMDIDDGYILWTGIWKALGNSKADIVKMIDSQPDLASLIRRVRGGYLKIQGTWMPYEVALRLSRRVAWTIREDLVPLFGPTFPSTCLSPSQPGYGQVVASAPGRRRAPRKSSAPTASVADAHSAWSVASPRSSESTSDPRSGALPHASQAPYPPQYAPYNSHPEAYQQEILQSSDRHSLSLPPPIPKDRVYARYSPYPNQSPPLSTKNHSRGPLALHIPSTDSLKHRSFSDHNAITLPPISPATSSRNPKTSGASYALPPISALEDLRGIDASDSAAVLRRLQSQDDADAGWHGHTAFAKSPSSWHSGPAAFPPPPKHRLSDPSVRYIRSSSSRDRLSVSASSDGDFSSHPSPISPSSPSTPLTPLSSKDSLSSSFTFKEHGRLPGCASFPAASSQPLDRVWTDGRGLRALDLDGSSAPAYRRNVDRDSENRQPYRPW